MSDAENQPIRLLIADDHYFVRMGLADSLRDEMDFEVIGEAESGQQAIDMYRDLQPDVLILDLMLGDMRGDEVLAALRGVTEGPILCVMLSVNEGEEDIYRCVREGAKAYLSKTAPRDDLIRAVRSVASGSDFFSPAIRAKLSQREQRPNLTPRELQTLRCLVSGLSNREIAKELSISEATAKLHVGNVLQKLDVMDRTQAVTAAIERGWVHL